jgi:hypothetical protein
VIFFFVNLLYPFHCSFSLSLFLPIFSFLSLFLLLTTQIVTTGLKMFEKNSANSVCDCLYRLTQECVHIIEPFMTDARKLIFPPEELAKLVNRDVCNHGGTMSLEGFSVAEKVKSLSAGAFIAITPLPETGEKIMVVCWRGRSDNNINIMCSKDALHIVGQRLIDMGIEVIFPAPNNKNSNNQAAEKEVEPADQNE